MEVINTLRSARVRRGLSQEEASKLLNINIGTLNKYEKDSTKITRDLIGKMENLYCISADYIFFGVESEFSRKLEKEWNTVKEVS